MALLLRSHAAIHSAESVIGGKAFHLCQLEGQNVFVPEWCVISVDEISRRLQKDRSLSFSSADRAELRDWIRTQASRGDKRFIVRSSMPGEDGSTLSFAGQLISIPNLSDLDSIINAIGQCAESLHSQRVLAYAQSGGRSMAGANIAVIVQVMIDADRSGVLFTADPKDGSRRRFLVSSTFGACEAVVSGAYECDEFEIDITTNNVTSRIATKMSVLRFGDRGLVEQAVSAEKVNQPSLNGEDLKKLTQIGKSLTAWMNRPVDIEFVFRGSEFFVVQVRPITSLPIDRSISQTFVFDNSNIQESFNGLTLPLTFSFAVTAYFQVYRQLMSIMGFSASTVAQHDRRHLQMLALVKGRVYYNIQSWYEGLLFLPSFGRNKSDMEHMMGVQEPVDFVVDQKLSRLQKIRRLPGIIALLARLLWAFARIDKTVFIFRSSFQEKWNAFPRAQLRWLSSHQIIEIHDRLKADLLSHWKAPILNDFFVMFMAGRVRRVLQKVGASEFLPDLLAGEDLESTRPTKAILQLAILVRSHPHLVRALLVSDREFEFALKSTSSVQVAIDEFIDAYGDRVIGELKLETRTYRQDKSFLFKILRSYVTDLQLDLNEFHARQLHLRKQAEDSLFPQIGRKIGRWTLLKFKRDLEKFRKAVRYREAMRLDRTRCFGLFRSLYLALGEKMAEQGYLDSEEDVFYLKSDEIDDFYYGKALFDDPKGLIRLRKAQYAEWSLLLPEPHLRTPLPFRDLQKEKYDQSQCEFQGLGCYPGMIEAEVVVVSQPQEPGELKGKILVAERTDPGWTPLFLQIKGLIVERGSQLSHSAVVARELGLPTIVGIPGIFRILKTGDRVWIDGQTGRIRRIDASLEAGVVSYQADLGAEV